LSFSLLEFRRHQGVGGEGQGIRRGRQGEKLGGRQVVAGLKDAARHLPGEPDPHGEALGVMKVGMHRHHRPHLHHQAGFF